MDFKDAIKHGLKMAVQENNPSIKLMPVAGVAQIQFYVVILWKSLGISLLIKVFCLLSDHSETCTKCSSIIEVFFHKVSLKLVKR